MFASYVLSIVIYDYLYNLYITMNSWFMDFSDYCQSAMPTSYECLHERNKLTFRLSHL